MMQSLTNAARRFFGLLEKPREYIFRIPGLRRLPERAQRVVYFSLSPAIILLWLLLYLYWGLPFPNQITSELRNPVSTQLLDRNGKLIYEIFEEKRRSPIKLEDLPPYVAQATIAIEDKDFYNHYGLSLTGILRAFFKTTTGQQLQGGSTITQQLVKTTLLSPERTLRRKIREVTLTLVIEIIYSKDRILEMYLNNIPYGGTAWGIEAAAQAYFDKPARELTLSEASLLAGLPQRPTSYSPFGTDPDRAKQRQEQVLRRMTEDGYITQEEADRAKTEVLTYAETEGIKAPHFALYVKEQLVELYGQDMVERGGLRVKTTLDLDVQEFAEKTVAEEVGKLKKAKVGNGAAMVTSPKTGEIYAMVGSKDYFAEDEDGKVNVTLRSRQPGSSIKPLNYAMAIENGKITAATPLADIPSCFTVLGQSLYCPVNYDGSFHGVVQARFALGNSYNIPAVRVLALNGVSSFVEFARNMGLSTLKDPKNYGLSLTLGGGEVRMVDMATAFGVFANGGLKQLPVSILEVKDWKGNLIEKTAIPDGDRVLSQETAYLISHILLDNNARSTVFGQTSYLNVAGHSEVSVKTGTTNDKRDNWTIGFSPEIVAVTWVGNNDNTPLGAVASGVSGASPIWNRITKFALDRTEAGDLSASSVERKKHTHLWPSKPADVVGTNICATNGNLPSGGDFTGGEQGLFITEESAGCPVRFEFFLEDYPPKPNQSSVRPIPVFRETGMMAPGDTSPDLIEIKDHQVLIDPLGTLVCLTCSPQDWSVTVNPANIVEPNLAPARGFNESGNEVDYSRPIGGE
ncbi:MAG: Penicillin-binding protein, 1A family [Microgenomates group bacterium Gr01-1014_5]|nr:MAG: Penicillin-binding protein, 1A family [Microgenomates group bacterium Gr01-1014_5]